MYKIYVYNYICFSAKSKIKREKPMGEVDFFSFLKKVFLVIKFV